jgi:primosomal protein N' (replication factor Y)
VFGEKVIVYNSRINNAERIEVWNEALRNPRIIVAARSGIFLPFTNLGLIIIDEEHDTSFKQDAPSPQYHARDVALYIASILKCKIILGSATPSLESYYNVKNKKFELVELKNRYGNSVLPKIEIIDLGYERKTGRYKEILAVPLIKRMQQTIEKNKQVILFQNRRGYVPTIQCKSCGWTALCDNCDVSLTLHKYTNEIKCHYCGSRKNVPLQCPQCNNVDLSEIGLGTEKVEQKVAEIFPQNSVGRFDFDTTRTKSSQEKILSAFAAGDIQVLVGTQMVTKGFDFDHVELVAIINADALMSQPDFRANERAFQLMTQVAGRSGRRDNQGIVMIQTYVPKHPVILEVLSHDYVRFFNRELHERQTFNFPPFVRLIMVEVKHKDKGTTISAANDIAHILQMEFHKRISAPITPAIERINNYYIRQIVLKLERNANLVKSAKDLLKKIKEDYSTKEGYKTVKIKIDVDPY